VFHAPDARRTHRGWRIKVLWVMRSDQQAVVTIEGSNVKTGQPLWFKPADAKAGPAAVLDPAHPGAPSERAGWLNFPSYLYVPSAGCYTLSARSSGEGWDMVFGFGQ
jgi:hypothetical protein